MNIHKVGYKQFFAESSRPGGLKKTVDGDKKVLVISDCHLTARYSAYYFEKFRKIIQESDLVVINGDFWDDSKVTFDKFVKSKWKALFPLLKKKHAIYIFGNHDMPLFSDKRIALFCDKAGFSMKLKAGTLDLHIEHGHLLSGKIVATTLRLFEGKPMLLSTLTYPMQLFENFGLQLAKRLHIHPFSKINSEFKKKRHSVSDPGEYFAMGHTHIAELDLENKYLNSGLTHKGYFNFVEIYNSKIYLNQI